MKAKIINGCIGCGACVGICPEVFKLGESGYAEVTVSEISPKNELSVIEASESCPVSVIIVE